MSGNSGEYKIRSGQCQLLQVRVRLLGGRLSVLFCHVIQRQAAQRAKTQDNISTIQTRGVVDNILEPLWTKNDIYSTDWPEMHWTKSGISSLWIHKCCIARTWTSFWNLWIWPMVIRGANAMKKNKSESWSRKATSSPYTWIHSDVS